VNVISLRVPPLRERIPDLRPLVDHILQRLAERHLETRVPRLTDDAFSKLLSYRFPGNVRELENILERAIALSADDLIHADDIQLQHDPDPSSPADTQAAQPRLGQQLESVERDAIIRALEQHRYNKTAAAKSLGLTLRALRYRMQKLGID